MSSAHAEAQENNVQFCAALRRRDLDGLMAYYDLEICLLIPGAPPIRGHDGMRAYYEQVFAAGINDASMETVQARRPECRARAARGAPRAARA